MLYHEAKVGKELTHPNVIRITYVSEEKANHYFVMEYFPAGSLKVRLVNKQFDFIRERAHSIFKQAATGLAYINASGWVHRDIKPDNLLVNSAGEAAHHRLRHRPADRGRRASSTSCFARRERCRGRAATCRRSRFAAKSSMAGPTFTAMGRRLYELTTYRPPFRAASQQELLQKHILEKPVPPISLVPELTPEFNNLVLKCLAKKPDDRLANFP